MKKAVFLFSLIVLTACQTKMDAATQNAVANYYPQEVTTSRAAGFNTGIKLINNEDANALADKFVTETKSRVSAEFRSYLLGRKPAKVNILFDQIHLASSAGRIAFAQDSYVNGTITVTDSATGNIVTAHKIRAVDAAVKGQGAIGIVAAAIVNSASSAEATRISKLSAKFSEETKKWMTAPRK